MLLHLDHDILHTGLILMLGMLLLFGQCVVRRGVLLGLPAIDSIYLIDSNDEWDLVRL